MKNPFVPYPSTRGPVKLLLYGDPGTEKTRRALTMPGPRYMVDLEKGADEYGALTQPGDQYLACQSHAALVQALDYLDSVAGTVGTLIVDPITVVWQSLQAGHIEREARRKNVNPEQVLIDQGAWSRLNRVHNDIMTRLLNAPYHVVMVARGKELRENDKIVGYGYDGHKSLEFLAKTVLQTRRSGDVVVKDRTGTWTDGQRGRLDIRDLLATAGRGGAVLESASEAAARDATDGGNTAENAAPTRWTDQQRKAFHGELRRVWPELSTSWPDAEYEVIAGWCQAHGHLRPSEATPSKRHKLLVALTEAETRVKILEWAGATLGSRVVPAEETA